MAEEPPLQVVALLSPQGAQLIQCCSLLLAVGLNPVLAIALPQFPAMQFGILKLSAPDVSLIGFLRQPRLMGHRPRVVNSLSALVLFISHRLSQRPGLMVQLRDLSLMGLEITVGLQVVEHRGHESRPVAATTDLTAVGCEIRQMMAPLPTGHHQHAHHLAPVDVGAEGVGQRRCRES